MVILTPMFRRPSAVIVSPLPSIVELSTQDETSTLVCLKHTHTHTHTHTQCLSFKNPKPIFTYPAAAIATICKEQYYFPDIKSWKIFWPLEWDKKRKRLWNTWIRDLAHLRMEILYFLSSHLSVFIHFPFKWPQLCTSVLLFPLYLLCLTNQEVYVFITLYTAPVSTAPLHIRYISVLLWESLPSLL